MNFAKVLSTVSGAAFAAISGVALSTQEVKAGQKQYYVNVQAQSPEGPYNLTIKAPNGVFPINVPTQGNTTAQAANLKVFCQGFSPTMANKVSNDTWKAQCPKYTLWFAFQTEDGFPLIDSAQVQSNTAIVTNPGVGFEPFKGVDAFNAGLYPEANLERAKEQLLQYYPFC